MTDHRDGATMSDAGRETLSDTVEWRGEYPSGQLLRVVREREAALARVAELEDALRDLLDNGNPAVTEEGAWFDARRRARRRLADLQDKLSE